jgi:hypothetical protein
MIPTPSQPSRPGTRRSERYGSAELESLVRDQLEEERARRPGRGARLHCVQCGAPITTEADRMVMAGRHEHSFHNPHDLAFRIGCFASAPGCAQQGAATQAWTWFPGYSWQVAVCAGCRVHLGWRYRGTEPESFYGLILNRLVRRDA